MISENQLICIILAANLGFSIGAKIVVLANKCIQINVKVSVHNSSPNSTKFGSTAHIIRGISFPLRLLALAQL